MENTVTLSLKDYELLKNGFEQSQLRKDLEYKIKQIEHANLNLQKTLHLIKDESFIFLYCEGNFASTRYYLRKNKTPNWINMIFNHK